MSTGKQKARTLTVQWPVVLPSLGIASECPAPSGFLGRGRIYWADQELPENRTPNPWKFGRLRAGLWFGLIGAIAVLICIVAAPVTATAGSLRRGIVLGPEDGLHVPVEEAHQSRFIRDGSTNSLYRSANGNRQVVVVGWLLGWWSAGCLVFTAGLHQLFVKRRHALGGSLIAAGLFLPAFGVLSLLYGG